VGRYGYCIVPAGHEPPAGLLGIDDRPVSAHESGELAIWISEAERAEPNAANVQAHNRVIEAAVTETVTPVPLRFGQWSERAAVFDDVVREKAEWYRERLAAFAGAMEFGIRVAQPDKPQSARLVRVPPAPSGLEYMKALRANVVAGKEEQAGQESVREAISAAVAGLVREERFEEARTPHGVVSAAHLVSRSHFDQYRERVQRLRQQFPEMRFLLSGPWVPYSFAV
jgi:hypothetical protein